MVKVKEVSKQYTSLIGPQGVTDCFFFPPIQSFNGNALSFNGKQRIERKNASPLRFPLKDTPVFCDFAFSALFLTPERQIRKPII